MSEPVTIIGCDTVVSGNLEGDEDLIIEGRVEGSISLSRTLTVETGGNVRADISVRNAVVSGVLVGNIEAQESVHITEEGRVIGDISAPRVILVDGSSFKGSIDMGDFDIDQEAETARQSRNVTPSVKRAVSEVQEIQESVEEEVMPRVRRVTPVAAPKKTAPAREIPVAKKTVPSKSVPKKTPVKKTAPEPKVKAIGKKQARKKK